MTIKLILILAGTVSFLPACAGKVSGRLDLQQRFAAGVEVQGTKSDKTN